MAKFSAIIRGTRATSAIELPPPDGGTETIPCLIRALNGMEEGAALSSARKRAITQGVAEPKNGDPIYDLAVMVERLALSCMDEEQEETPKFDGGSEQILGAYGAEAIAFIHEMQATWQDEVSPTMGTLSADDVFESIDSMGDDDEARARRFFLQLRPAFRWSCMRTLALLRRGLPSPKSAFTSPSDGIGRSSKKTTAGASRKKRGRAKKPRQH